MVLGIISSSSVQLPGQIIIYANNCVSAHSVPLLRLLLFLAFGLYLIYKSFPILPKIYMHILQKKKKKLNKTNSKQNLSQFEEMQIKIKKMGRIFLFCMFIFSKTQTDIIWKFIVFSCCCTLLVEIRLPLLMLL